MRALSPCILIAAILIGCAPADPIDTLVATLSRQRPEMGQGFPNGPWMRVALPATTSPTQLVSTVLPGALHGIVTTNVSILETRHVRIAYDEEIDRVSDPNYLAVLVETSRGQHIILSQFAHHDTNDIWLARVYDVN